MNKTNAFRRILVVFVLILLIGGVTIYIIDTTGYRVKVGLGYLYEISKNLSNYHNMNGDYPESYSVPKQVMKEKCLKAFSYKRRDSSNYEITAVVNNFVKKDVLLKANPEGVFIQNRMTGDWQRWFNSIKN